MSDETEAVQEWPGPGIFEGVPEATYHALDAASQSRLKVLDTKSPKHLRYSIDNPKESTPALTWGSAIHDAALLPDVFDEKYGMALQCEAITGKGTQCSNTGSVSCDGHWYCGIKGHNPGGPADQIEVLTQEQYESSLLIRDNIHAHPSASFLLDCELKELSVTWIDEATGLLCKGRFDALSNDGTIIADIKSCRDASKIAFSKQIYDYGYHMQAAYYIQGARAHDIPAEHFVIIAVEKAPPYEMAVYDIHAEAVDAGTQALRPLMAQYAECLEKNEWPGYPTKAIPITLPPYAWKQIEQREMIRDEAELAA